ncbi:hypothetical protein [Hymenobacter sp. 102]|uniref:hypothetical protein n=1 Tax=Hymenobacter sp. 102 TaxID=3403152 RepID=UPI003CE6CDDC
MHNYYFLLIGGMLAASTVQAQNSVPAPIKQHVVRLGAGSSLNGSGDYPMLKLHLEYAPQVGRHGRLASRLAYIGNSHPYEFGGGYTIPQSYRAVNLEQEIHWLPFGANKTLEFGIGGGGFVGYAAQNSWLFARLNNQQFEYQPRREKGFHVGYIASAYLDVALNQENTWRLGDRIALQNDTRANILPGAQLQLSRAW